MNYKKESMKNWGKDPCGSNYSKKEFGSKKYFEDIAKHRYSTHPWIKKIIAKYAQKNKKYLEIGFGMGTDLLEAAKLGAKVYGVDITPRNREVATKRFKYYGKKANLITTDCEKLSFKDNEFDSVYSLGVIHHTPNTQKAINEIHRVLKPDGKCAIIIYHKNSLFYWWTEFIFTWILHGKFLYEPFMYTLSRNEYPGGNPNILVKAYDKNQALKMFKKFKNLKISIEQIQPGDIAIFGEHLRKKTINKLSKKYGWYLIVEGTK